MNAVHHDYLELAAAAIDFELTTDERSRLERHLETCDACRRRVPAIRADDRAIAALPRFILSPAGMERLRPTHPRAMRLRPPTLRLVLIAGLIALLAVSAVGVGAALIREMERRLLAIPQVLPTTEVTTNPTPAPSPTEMGDGWRLVGEPAGMANAEIGAVAVSEQRGVVVAGCVEVSAASCGDAVIWRSDDGVSWAAPRILPVGGEPLIRVPDVAMATGDRILVAGQAESAGRPRVVVWSSADEASWIRAPHDASFDSARIVQIIEFDGRFVAVGSGDFGEPSGFRAWTSVDGTTWTSAAGPAVVDESFPIGMIASGPNELLAWGSPASVGPAGTRWWASGDGRTWANVDEPAGLEGATVVRIDETEAGLVASGTMGDPVSPSTRQWERLSASAPWTESEPSIGSPVEPVGAVRRVLDVGPGTVAMGMLEADDFVTAIWYRGPGETAWRLAAEISGGEPIDLFQQPSNPGRLFMFVRNDSGVTVLWTGAVDWQP